MGSLLTATASWLDARAHGGRWRLRIDDLDAPRVAAAAETAILHTLEVHGLAWDGAIVRQSDHVDHYRAALADLGQRCFACRCSRRELRGSTRYPGACRHLGLPQGGNAVRIQVGEDAAPVLAFDDRVQGRYSQRLADSVGDFVVWRRDGFASYPLAVVVDDETMGVTHIVRGADLLDNTPRQLHLMACLGFAPPAYAHVPVIAEASGEKLSKHNAATAIDDRAARHNVATVLTLLALAPPTASVDAMLDWAIRHWDIRRLPQTPVLSGFVALA